MKRWVCAVASLIAFAAGRGSAQPAATTASPARVPAAPLEAAAPSDAPPPTAANAPLDWLELGAMLQLRYVQTFAPASHNPRTGYALREDVWVRQDDGFLVRRLYLRMKAEPSWWLAVRLVLDFSRFERGGLKGVVHKAYARLSPWPDRVELSAGVLDRPYAIMKLDSSADFELADYGPATDLVNDLDFAGRDAGVQIMLAPLPKPRWLRLYASAFAGHAYDEHASPLGGVGARLESRPIKHVRLGLDAVHHPYTVTYKQPFDTSSKDTLPAPADPLYPRSRSWARGSAYGADVTYAAHGLMLRAEGLFGDRVDVDDRYGARRFGAAWALVAYRFRFGDLALQPVARGEWFDADLDHDVGTRRTVSLGLNLHMPYRLRLLLDVTHTEVDAGSPLLDPPRPLPAIPYFELDHTRVTAQLQVEI